MPKITIDRQTVEVPSGETILDAARRLGIEIPAMCFHEGCTPSTSCLVCSVKLRGTDRFVPACATVVVDGMEIDSDTDEVRDARRTALELLLSDHTGDCLGQCQLLCPAGMDIPRMIRQIQAGRLADAIVTIKHDIALPAVLGRVCSAPCEKGCRRGQVDSPVGIRLLKQFVADVDLANPEPYRPKHLGNSGKRVAVVGAGATGLAATYYLRRAGHAVSLFDQAELPGGRLRTEFSRQTLPHAVLDAEIEQILRLGVDLRLNTSVQERGDPSLDRLQGEFDAVLFAWGPGRTDLAAAIGLPLGKRGIEIDKAAYQTERPSVFAAGGAVRGESPVVRRVADGKEAAWAIDAFLAGRVSLARPRPFTTRMGHTETAEVALMMAGASPLSRPEAKRNEPFADAAEAAAEAARCLHCDCRDRDGCQLRRWSELFDADQARYRAPRRPFEQHRHPAGVIHEPGKCISCGLCVQIAARDRAALGMTFIGRGFDVRVGVPFDRSLLDALGKTAAACVAACPTSALRWE